MQSSSSKREISLVREAEEGETACCICMHRFANAVLDPCKHAEFCWTCVFSAVKSTKKCPLCRAPVKNCTPVHPIPANLTSEERIWARKMEIDAYDKQELQEYAESFGLTAEEMLADIAEKMACLELSD